MRLGGEPEGFMRARYCSENWEQLYGLSPFIATGPAFSSWAIGGSLDLYGEHRFVRKLHEALRAIPELPDDLAREAIAELLLREGIVQALWSVDFEGSLPEPERWEAAVRRLTSEISSGGPAARWTIELLSGMSGPERFRSYVFEDGLTLEVGAIPRDGL